MKNKIFNSAMGMLMCISLFASGMISAQNESDTSDPSEANASGEISAISVKIATLYQVDNALVERFVQAAVNLETRIGISAPVTIAIAIHESSFKSPLYMNAGNPFGIKASKPWIGPTFSKWDDGAETKFRVYASPEEALWDFGNFIKSRDWYADVLDCPFDDSRCVIDALKKTENELGYSMNPFWDEAVLGIIENMGLQGLVIRD